MKPLCSTLIFLVLNLFIVNGGFTQDKNPKKIAEKMLANYYYANNDGRFHVFMEIVSKSGQKRRRDFIILRKNAEQAKDQFYYIYFYKPADVRGVVFLVNKHVGREDDRWLYFPAIDLVRRISANDKRSSFVGSDFTYEDVSGRPLEDDKYEYLGEESRGRKKCFLIKAVPQDSSRVEFSYRKIWVEENLFLPIRLEYYNKRGELYKVFETLEIKTIAQTPTVVKGKMTDLEKKRFTTMEFTELEYNLGIPRDIFTERYLRRPPREWIE